LGNEWAVFFGNAEAQRLKEHRRRKPFFSASLRLCAFILDQSKFGATKEQGEGLERTFSSCQRMARYLLYETASFSMKILLILMATLVAGTSYAQTKVRVAGLAESHDPSPVFNVWGGNRSNWRWK
jgi:hypothetical protein